MNDNVAFYLLNVSAGNCWPTSSQYQLHQVTICQRCVQLFYKLRKLSSNTLNSHWIIPKMLHHPIYNFQLLKSLEIQGFYWSVMISICICGETPKSHYMLQTNNITLQTAPLTSVKKDKVTKITAKNINTVTRQLIIRVILLLSNATSVIQFKVQRF